MAISFSFDFDGNMTVTECPDIPLPLPMAHGRKMTPAEIEEMATERIEVGAVGQNAHVCECGRIRHTPNGLISNSVFRYSSCSWCENRRDD